MQGAKEECIGGKFWDTLFVFIFHCFSCVSLCFRRANLFVNKTGSSKFPNKNKKKLYGKDVDFVTGAGGEGKDISAENAQPVWAEIAFVAFLANGKFSIPDNA